MNNPCCSALCLFIAALLFSFPAALSADESVLALHKRWTGDFDGMCERNVIRALVPYSKTFYFLDGAHQRGLTYERMKRFERYVNKELKRRTLKVRVVIIPTERDRLLPALVEGLGDIAAGNLTITPERKRKVDFSDPHLTGVNEIVVTGPSAPAVDSLDDLSGNAVYVRASSSYHASLKQLNTRFGKRGKKKVEIIRVGEYLEDEDLLEMMNAGLIPMVVMDDHKAVFWSQIFNDITLHPHIPLRTGGRIAWAVRKDSPRLKRVINDFMKTHKKGTLTGNILFKRYLDNTKWVRKAHSKEEIKKFKRALSIFKKYANIYNFDHLMLAALAYQESGINQNKRSPAGAVGVMQILPSTAADPNVNISDIENMQNNIHAGTKYLHFIRSRYFEKEKMDRLNKMLFTFASYNAGPAAVAGLRRRARQEGLDPNTWFRNVERIAAREIGRETVQYVGNIYKYYIAYSLIVDDYLQGQNPARQYD